MRVVLSTVNRTDCAYRAARPVVMRALTGFLRPRRTILGTEFAGEVVGTGPQVDRFCVGDRVFGYSEHRRGLHAEYAVLPQRGSLARVPDGVDWPAAAAATEGYHYARSALVRAGVRPGDHVLVNGATGGIGSAAVQQLAAAGVTVTAVCLGEHADLVRGLGADHVVDRATQDFTAGTTRFHVVFDAVGTSSFGRCRRICARTGSMSPPNWDRGPRICRCPWWPPCGEATSESSSRSPRTIRGWLSRSPRASRRERSVR